MFSKTFVEFSIILSSIFISANAISCYQCNSVNDTECDDLSSYRPHLTAGFFKECNEFGKYGDLKPFCRKTVVEILLPLPEKRTTRSCGWVQYQRPCYKADNDDHLETSCQCFEDGCNGSDQLHMNIFGAVSLLILCIFGFSLYYDQRFNGWC